MARIETFARDLRLATAAIAPENVAKELARFARAELARVIESGEGSPDYDRYVNGRMGAAEESVVPPGPILYVFTWWSDIVAFALQYLVERGPERSGRYKRSWTVLADGQPVENPKAIRAAQTVAIVNTQPYHRKIDVGHMRMRVPHHVVDDGRKAVLRVFGNLVTARRTMMQLPGGYILKGVFRRGVLPFARSGLKRDTQAGVAMTYPALVMQLRHLQ